MHSWAFTREKSSSLRRVPSLAGTAHVNKYNMYGIIQHQQQIQKTKIVQCSTRPAGIQLPYRSYCTNCSMNCCAIIRPLALIAIFMPLISLSMSSINWMMKSISLCFQSFSR